MVHQEGVGKRSYMVYGDWATGCLGGGLYRTRGYGSLAEGGTGRIGHTEIRHETKEVLAKCVYDIFTRLSMDQWDKWKQMEMAHIAK